MSHSEDRFYYDLRCCAGEVGVNPAFRLAENARKLPSTENRAGRDESHVRCITPRRIILFIRQAQLLELTVLK